MFQNFEYFTISVHAKNACFQGWNSQKKLVSITNREDTDQTASEEAVWSGSALFVEPFLAGNKCSKF